MRPILIAALLVTQEPIIDLDFDRRALWGGSPLAAITFIARYEDGRPVRGFVRCLGTWYKHADEDTVMYASELPFKTDSRGAVIMNPHVDDEWIQCYVAQDGYYGETRVEFDRDHPTAIVEIVVKKTT